jgi:GH35 family endo-1,4-beta-xylanase
VTVQNQNTDALALTAANNYIANYRRGDATVALPGLAPGTQVQVDMKKLAFDFGAAIGQSDLTTNTALQNFVNKNFNMLVPANAGKWSSEEFIQGRPSTNQSNAILNYAAAHGMGARQHNLIWSAQPLSNAQQPNFAVNLLNTAVGTDPTAAAAASTTLRTDISSRINYYVDPARGRYSQVDVYNESFFNGAIIPFSTTYWRVYGASGIAGIYNEMNQKLAAAGQNARTYVNDYNILQNGYDNYGNFYAQHIETIENGDNNPSNGTVGGIGIQYYVLSGHSTARIQQVMQNLSALNLPISLTEFGVQNSVAADSATAQGMLTDSMRMMFGNPNATSFLIWGWSSNATSNLQSSSVLVDGTYLTLTNCGKDWEDLLGIQDFDGDVNDGWSTHLTATVEADGTINFNGYYGDYALTINNQPYDLNLLKGTTQYLVQVPEPATVVLAGISLLTVIMAWWMRKTGAL